MISSNEINKNDIVSFKVEDVAEFSDGTKAYKLGDYFVSEDTLLNRMKITSVESSASTDMTNTYSSFDRTGLGDEYWYIDIDGEVELFQDAGEPIDKELHNVANYCTDKKLIEQRAMHEVLNRLLWRYSEEHGGDIEWAWDKGGYSYQKHWYIYFSHTNKGFHCAHNDAHETVGTIYFKSEKIAQNAIKNVIKPFIEKHPDFVW